MTSIDVPFNKTYPPLLMCMYCFDKPATSELTTEHIIPKAIAGALVLPRSVCGPCQIKTQKAERDCISKDGIFYAVKEHLKLPSRSMRRNKTPRPTSLPVAEFDGSFDEQPENMQEANFKWVDLPLAKHPLTILMPGLARAGYLLGQEPSENYTLKNTGMYFDRLLDPIERGRIRSPMVKFNPGSLCKLFAKIAHGAAVAEIGLDNFSPFLPPYILGTEKSLSYYVGTLPDKPEKTQQLHNTLIQNEQLLIGHVRLFGNFELPAWEVVIGELHQNKTS